MPTSCTASTSTQHHGLVARAEYAPLHDTSAVDGTAIAGILDYRYHFAPKMQSFFVGAYGRYRYVYGDGSVDGAAFDFEVPEVNVGLHAGYRWVIWSGINAVFAAAYGYSWQRKKLSTPPPAGCPERVR
jgi:hypothetical protein